MKDISIKYSEMQILFPFYLMDISFIFYWILYPRIVKTFGPGNLMLPLAIFFQIARLIFGTIYYTIMIVRFSYLDWNFINRTWRISWVENWLHMATIIMILALTNRFLTNTGKGFKPAHTAFETGFWVAFSFLSLLLFIILTAIQLHANPNGARYQFTSWTDLYVGILLALLCIIGYISTFRAVFANSGALQRDDKFLNLFKGLLLFWFVVMVDAAFSLMDGVSFDAFTNNTSYTYLKPIGMLKAFVRLTELILWCELVMACPEFFIRSNAPLSSSSSKYDESEKKGQSGGGSTSTNSW